MNVQQIGECAGIVWRLLNGENRKWEYEEIKKVSGLTDCYLNAAIGWLAREGKIQIENGADGKSELFYLELNYYIG